MFWVLLLHIQLTSPTPRYTELKQGPCGRGATDARTTNVSTFRPGETITVVWTETIDHPGHFRISFDSDGSNDFVDPRNFTDVNTAPSVLVDNIMDRAGSQLMYMQQVTLPNIECTNCTLQVIQVMTDKPPYGDGNDIYYQCADLVLSAGAPAPPPPSPDAGGNSTGDPVQVGSGCSAVPASRPAAAWWLLVLLLVRIPRVAALRPPHSRCPGSGRGTRCRRRRPAPSSLRPSAG